MSSTSTDEISLKDVWKEVYRRKWLLILVSVLFSVIAAVIALNLPNLYKSKITLVPHSEEQGGLSSLAKNFGGLASLAGMGLGDSGGPDPAVVALEILKSQHFITKFIRKHKLIVPLMAAIGSDPMRYELILDEDVYNIADNKWMREVSPPKLIEPSDEEIYKEFMDIFEISQDPKTGFISASIEFFSPKIAQEWLQLIILDINNEIKLTDRIEAEKSILFLNKTLARTSNTNMQTTFYQLIEEQSKKLMLTESREEYIFKSIFPATLPEKRSKPSRVLIVLAGIILGGILSLFYILTRYFIIHEE